LLPSQLGLSPQASAAAESFVHNTALALPCMSIVCACLVNLVVNKEAEKQTAKALITTAIARLKFQEDKQKDNKKIFLFRFFW
jgi:hypothetical protein